jgi:hypothetical protein
MAEIGLIPYVLFGKRFKRKHRYIDLNDFADQANMGIIILDLMNKLKKSGVMDDEDFKRTFEVKRVTRAGYAIYGTILSGIYGLPGQLLNRKTKRVTHKTADDADVKSFFFYFDVPDGVQGDYIVVLQAYDYMGIKTALFERLIMHFESTMKKDFKKSYTLEMNTIIPSWYLKPMLEKLKVKKLRLISYKSKLKLSAKSVETQSVNLEVAFKAKRGQSLRLNSNLIDYFNGNISNLSGVFEIPSEFAGVERSNIKLDVVINGKSKTINMKSMDVPRYSESIDEDTLLFDTDNFIKEEVFLGRAIDLAARLRAEMTRHDPVADDDNSQE